MEVTQQKEKFQRNFSKVKAKETLGSRRLLQKETQLKEGSEQKHPRTDPR
jgi:hypothetical protein